MLLVTVTTLVLLLINAGGASSDTLNSELCFIPSRGVGWEQNAHTCIFPFEYVNKNKTRTAVLAAPSFASLAPGGLETLKLSNSDWSNAHWCPINNRYSRWSKANKRKWGVAECSRPCVVPAGATTGFLTGRAQATHCQFPFRFYSKSTGWKTYDYPPRFDEVEPFGYREGSAGLDVVTQGHLRWCPEIGIKDYDSREGSETRTAWGVVSCGEQRCHILGHNGYGWIAEHDDDCQLPFAYRRGSEAEWQRFQKPPTLAEAPPYGLEELGLSNQSDILNRVRWCPRLGVRKYDPTDSTWSETELKEWGTVACDDESDTLAPTAKPTPSPVVQSESPTMRPTIWSSMPPTPASAQNCMISEGSVGWIQVATECQLPFLFTDLDGNSQTIDHPPSFAEAQPYGLEQLGLREDDELTRWCPGNLGIERHYDARDPLRAKLWGVAACDSDCQIGGENMNFGWIKRASPCELPFIYVRSNGTSEKYDLPPTILEAIPYGLQELGLEPETNTLHAAQRWCVPMGTKMYIEGSISKKWGIVSCKKDVVLPTRQPTERPVTHCSTDGGYAPYGETCVFPFTTAHGQVFHDCASLSQSRPYQGSNIPPNPPIADFALSLEQARWCALDPMYDASLPSLRKRWGYCNARTCGICASDAGIACMRLDQVPSEGRLPLLGQVFSDHCLVPSDDPHGRPVCVEDSEWNRKHGGTREDRPWSLAHCDIQACRLQPTQEPTDSPTFAPTKDPSSHPSRHPTRAPTRRPNTPIPTVPPAHCTTNGGGYVKAGSQCVFPFSFRGKSYTECALVNETRPYSGINERPKDAPSGREEDQERWCPTVRRYSTKDTGKRKQWGLCHSNCAKHSTPTAPTPAPTRAAPSEHPTQQPSKAPTMEINAPRAVSARYSESGALVQILLSGPLHSSVPTYDRTWFACSRVIEDIDIVRLSCRWFANHRGLFVQPTRRRITLVTLKQGALQADQSYTSPRQAIAVELPNDIENQLFYPVLVAPTVVSPCDDMRRVLLDASQSYNIPLLTEIHFLVRKSSDADPENQAGSEGQSRRGLGSDYRHTPIVLSHCSFSSFVRAPSYKDLLCEFDLIDFLAAAEDVEAIDVAIQTRSIFESTATSEWRTIRVASQLSLALLVDTPSRVEIPFGQTRDLAFQVIPSLPGSKCVSDSDTGFYRFPDLKVEWSARLNGKALRGAVQRGSDLFRARVSPASANGQLAYGDRVEISVDLSHPDVKGISSHVWSVVVTPPQGALPFILGGNRSLSLDMPIRLDASLSQSPEEERTADYLSVNETSAHRFRWRCWPKHACASYLPHFESQGGNRVLANWALESGADGAAAVASELPVLVLSSPKSPDGFSGVQVLTIELAFFDATELVELHIANFRDRVPSLPWIESWSAVVASEGSLQLQGLCSSDNIALSAWALRDPNNVGEWLSLALEGPSASPFVSALRTTASGSWLEIDTSKLVAITDHFPGDRFEFRLDCGKSHQANSTVSIPVLNRPYNGQVEAAPTSGMAAETPFELYTWDWLDADSRQPPQFQFEFVAIDALSGAELTSGLTFATSLGTGARFSSIIFPYLAWPGNKVRIEIVAVAHDASGLRSVTKSPVHILLEHNPISRYERQEKFLLLSKMSQRNSILESSVTELWRIANTIAQLALDQDRIEYHVAICGAQKAFFDRIARWLRLELVPVSDLPRFVLQVAPLIPVALASVGSIAAVACVPARDAAISALRALLETWAKPIKNVRGRHPVWDSRDKAKAVRTISAALKATYSVIPFIPNDEWEKECLAASKTLDAAITPLLDLVCKQKGGFRALRVLAARETAESIEPVPMQAASDRALDVLLEGLSFTFTALEFEVPGIVRCYAWRQDLETFLEDRQLVLESTQVLFPGSVELFRGPQDDRSFDARICHHSATEVLHSDIPSSFKLMSSSLIHVATSLNFTMPVQADALQEKQEPRFQFSFVARRQNQTDTNFDAKSVMQVAICARWEPVLKTVDAAGCKFETVETLGSGAGVFVACSCRQNGLQDSYVGLFQSSHRVTTVVWGAQWPVALLLVLPFIGYIVLVVWGVRKDEEQAAARARALFLVALRITQLKRLAQREGFAALLRLGKDRVRLQRQSTPEGGMHERLLLSSISDAGSASSDVRSKSKASTCSNSSTTSPITVSATPRPPPPAGSKGASSSPVVEEVLPTRPEASPCGPRVLKGGRDAGCVCSKSISCCSATSLLQALKLAYIQVLTRHLFFSQFSYFDLKLQRAIRALLCVLSTYLVLSISTAIVTGNLDNEAAGNAVFSLLPLPPLCALPVVLIAKFAIGRGLPASGGSGVLRALRPSTLASDRIRNAWEEKEDLLMLCAKKDAVREAAAALTRLNVPPPAISETNECTALSGQHSDDSRRPLETCNEDSGVELVSSSFLGQASNKRTRQNLAEARSHLHAVMHEVTAAEAFVLKRHNARRRAQLTRRLQGVQSNVSCNIRGRDSILLICAAPQDPPGCCGYVSRRSKFRSLDTHRFVEEVLHPRSSNASAGASASASGSDGEPVVSPFRSPTMDVNEPGRFAAIWTLPFITCLVILILSCIYVVVRCAKTGLGSDQGWRFALFILGSWACDLLLVQPLYILFVERYFSPRSPLVSPSGPHALPDPANPNESEIFFAPDARNEQSSRADAGPCYSTRRRREEHACSDNDLLEQQDQAEQPLPYSGFQEVRQSGSRSQACNFKADETGWLYGADSSGDDAGSCAGESTASSFAQVPQRLLEEESETFRAALRRILNEGNATQNCSATGSGIGASNRRPGAVFITPADITASLGELELETDF